MLYYEYYTTARTIKALCSKENVSFLIQSNFVFIANFGTERLMIIITFDISTTLTASITSLVNIRYYKTIYTIVSIDKL